MSYTEQLVSLKGNLGSNVEMRYMPSGAPVANVSIGTTSYWKDKNSGEQCEKTEWHSLVFHNRGSYRLAELASSLRKGECIRVKGELRTRSWIDKNAQTVKNFLSKVPNSGSFIALIDKLATRYTVEIIVSDLEIIDNQRLRGVIEVSPQTPSPNFNSAPMAAPQPANNIDSFDNVK